MLRINRKLKHFGVLILVIIVGFALRSHELGAADFNLDETWSFLHSYYVAYPASYTIIQTLGKEPNNALHLFLASGGLKIQAGAFGLRLISLFAGVLSIALVARIAFRLFGRNAAYIAAVFISFAYAPVLFSQVGRPYALSTFFALLATVGWIERRWRLQMYAGVLTVFSHIGALPVIITQDLLGLYWHITRQRRMKITSWIVSRIVVYCGLLILLYLVYLRRNIAVISSGQTLPTLNDVLYHLVDVIYGGGLPSLEAASLLFFGGVVLPVIGFGIYGAWRKRFTEKIIFPLLWIVMSYLVLAVMAIVSDGPIKWVHLSHIAVAIVLVISAILAQTPRLLTVAITSIFIIVMTSRFIDHYNNPDLLWSDANDYILSIRQGDEFVYLQHETVMSALQLNNPDDALMYRYLPLETEPPTGSFLYFERQGWNPAPPIECPTETLWFEGNNMALRRCGED